MAAQGLTTALQCRRPVSSAHHLFQLFLLLVESWLAAPVSCGQHHADDCGQCPQGHGKSWCNGDCAWDASTGHCVPSVSCGRHRAISCSECPRGRRGPARQWCDGDCSWDPKATSCVARVSDDLYELLEVEDDADLTEIKKGYRRLSVLYHPDKNPDTAERFNAIRDAYEVLSNSETRILYDIGGMEAVRNAATGKAEMGEGVNLNLDLSLADFYRGATQKVTFHRRVICRRCRKTRDPARCLGCTACPPIQRTFWQQNGRFMQQMVQTEPSPEDCRVEATEVDVVVDRGARVGERVVFRHMGPQRPDKLPGDLTVTLQQTTEYNQWERRGSDLKFHLNLSLHQALLGFQRSIRHLDGHIVEVSTMSVTRPGQVLRIVGEGMPLQDMPSQFGDLFLVMDVIFPRALTAEQRTELAEVKAFHEWDQQSKLVGGKASLHGEL